MCYIELCFYCTSSHFLVILCWPIHGGHLMGAALPGMLGFFLWWGHTKFLWAVYWSRNWFCWKLSKQKWSRNILLFKGQTKYYMSLLACKLKFQEQLSSGYLGWRYLYHFLNFADFFAVWNLSIMTTKGIMIINSNIRLLSLIQLLKLFKVYS